MRAKGAKGRQPSLRSGELRLGGHALLGAAIQMVARLRDHIERVDDGVVYAIDDLAVVLRALICTGAGNDVLLRLASSMNLTIPEIQCSRGPEVSPEMRFGVGSIPLDAAGAIPDGAQIFSLSRWRDRPVIALTVGRQQRRFTWSRFISTYAHKWGGAHLDEIVPAELHLVDQSAAGGLVLSNYLLRAAASSVWWMAQAMFREAMNGPTRGTSDHASAPPIYGAPGSIDDAPRDRFEYGMLQYFFHVGDSGELLWYVDPTSSENRLRLMLGGLPYDVSYSSPKVDVPGKDPVPPQGPRESLKPERMVFGPSATLSTTQMSGRIRKISRDDHTGLVVT